MTQEMWDALMGVDESNDDAPIRGFDFSGYQEPEE